MTEIVFHNRRALALENDDVRVVLTVEGGHIAQILDKATGVNPLWIPPWPSIETTNWSPATHPEYGNDAESCLLAGIMGHNLCVDLFGAPTREEAAAGAVVHGEASIHPWEFTGDHRALAGRCVLPSSGLAVRRTTTLEGRRVRIHETVENLLPLDRPIAWTQHVTLGPPFLANGKTEFRMPGTRSRNLEETVDFDWPVYPRPDGVTQNLEVFPAEASSGGFTTHLMDRGEAKAWFTSWSPDSNVVFGYVWDRADFPWMGIWEENCFRTHAPWLRRAKARGMEFGVSPFPESRRRMIERQSLFGESAYRWIPARGTLSASYYAAIAPSNSIPESRQAFEALL